MQQRRPRLGDVLDDYCPRERRVTNHVVVAMIEDQVKQTRCTTCDGDHDYKQARTPSPRKPKAVAAIQDGADAFEPKPVLAAPVRGSADADAPAEAAMDDSMSADEAMPASAPLGASGGADDAPPALAASSESSLGDSADEEPLEPVRDEGPVHRRLIRATLPRPEGHVPERKEPEFTVRQQGGRGGGGGREVDGNSVGYRQKGGHRPPGGFGQGGQGGGGGHSRFGGQRNGSGPPQRQGGGGRPAPNGQRGGRPDGRPDGMSNSRGPRAPGSGGRRRGGR
jgi:hypothetical protein